MKKPKKESRKQPKRKRQNWRHSKEIKEEENAPSKHCTPRNYETYGKDHLHGGPILQGLGDKLPGPPRNLYRGASANERDLPAKRSVAD